MNELNVTSAAWMVLRGSGIYDKGDVVDTAQARALPVTIPVSPLLLADGGMSGFARVDLGRSAPVSEQPRLVASLALRAKPGISLLHWRAYLLASNDLIAELRAGRARMDGLLSVMPDVSVSPLRLDLAPGAGDDLIKLPSPDGRGGWLIGGHCPASAPMTGYYGLRLHGWGPKGTRVEWFAASVQ